MLDLFVYSEPMTNSNKRCHIFASAKTNILFLDEKINQIFSKFVTKLLRKFSKKLKIIIDDEKSFIALTPIRVDALTGFILLLGS